MEQKHSISSTLDKFSLIHNFPIEFFIGTRRSIRFRLPTIKELSTEMSLRMFVGILSMKEEQLKEMGIKLLVKPDSYGALAYGLLYNQTYAPVISQYLLKYIDNSELKDKDIYVNNEKISSEELTYIIDSMMISMSKKEYYEKETEKEEKELEDNPIMAKILAAQKEAEEKLNRIKQKKAKNNGDGYKLEEILLAVSYEFGLTMDYLLNLNYFALIWYFSFVAKVDAHKLNQMILSSGMSKQKKYNYWLNK